MKLSISIVFSLLLVCTGAVGQKLFNVSGKVTDRNGNALEQVTIIVNGTAQGTRTDRNGRYKLKLSKGKHVLTASYMGYHPESKTLDLRRDTRLNFRLKEDAIALNSVEVYGKSLNQQIREGAFAVSALDIRSRASSLNNINDLVNRATGIKVRQDGGLGSDFDLSINGMSGNSVRYFVDGVPLDTKGSAVTLANLPISLIDRIEIYKGVVPASLGADALGGAVNLITSHKHNIYLDVSYGIG